MTTLTQLALNRIKELGDKAAEHFGKKPSTVAMWLKTKKVPADVIEKVYAENPLMPSGQDVGQATEKQDDPDYERFSKIEALATNANQGVQQIVNHFNTQVAPEIGKIQSQVATQSLAIHGLIEKLEKLSRVRPQGVASAPTLGQLVQSEGQIISNGPVPANVIERDPHTSLVRPQGQTLQTFTETAPNSQHPLDTGLAPTLEQIKNQDAIRASGGDPSMVGTNRPAGPATQPASANYVNWTAPARR